MGNVVIVVRVPIGSMEQDQALTKLQGFPTASITSALHLRTADGDGCCRTENLGFAACRSDRNGNRICFPLCDVNRNRVREIMGASSQTFTAERMPNSPRKSNFIYLLPYRNVSF